MPCEGAGALLSRGCWPCGGLGRRRGESCPAAPRSPPGGVQLGGRRPERRRERALFTARGGSGRGATPRFRVAGSIGDGGRCELCSFPLLRTRWNWEAEALDLGKPHSRWDGSLLGTKLEFLAWRKQVGSLCWRLKHWLYILSFENLRVSCSSPLE